MAQRTSAWLHRISRGWLTFGALIAFVLFTVLVLPRQAAQAEAATGLATSPDTSLFYTPSELHQLAAAYGPDGRAAYVRTRFTFDLIWPLVYLAFLATSLSYVYARAAAPGSRWRLANLAPVAGVILDYLENLSASVVMLRYPATTAVVAHMAPAFTLLKWAFVGGSIALLLGGVAAVLWRRARRSGPVAA
jgi:hypothetical protein